MIDVKALVKKRLREDKLIVFYYGGRLRKRKDDRVS